MMSPITKEMQSQVNCFMWLLLMSKNGSEKLIYSTEYTAEIPMATSARYKYITGQSTLLDNDFRPKLIVLEV